MKLIKDFLWGIAPLLLLVVLLVLIIVFLRWWRYQAGCEFPAETLASEIPARCLAFYR